MPDPTKYERSHSFSDYQANNPSQPLPGPQVDNELENIEQSLNGTIKALNDVRRADGKLQNGIVTPDNLAPGLLATLGPVIAGMDAISTVADNIVAVETVADNIADVRLVARNIPAIFDARKRSEAGAVRSEKARDIAASYASDAVSQGNVPIYATVVGMAELTIPAGITALRTNGYAAPGDGEGGLYKCESSKPAIGEVFQTADGAWWSKVPLAYAQPSAFELIAHRGFATIAPENTLSAYYYAVAAGVSIEMDIQITADDVPVVMHDDTVDRTTDGSGAVSSYSLADLQALNAADTWPARFQPARVPRFDDVLALAQGKVRVYAEIKKYRTQADIDLMLAAITNRRMDEQVALSSFSLTDLQYARRKNRKIQLDLIGSNISAIGEFSRLGGRLNYCLDYNAVLTNPGWIETIRAAGMDLSVWTVDSNTAARSLRALGVTKIMSNKYLEA